MFGEVTCTAFSNRAPCDLNWPGSPGFETTNLRMFRGKNICNRFMTGWPICWMNMSILKGFGIMWLAENRRATTASRERSAVDLLRFGNKLEGRRLRRPRYRGEHRPLLGIGKVSRGASASSPSFSHTSVTGCEGPQPSRAFRVMKALTKNWRATLRRSRGGNRDLEFRVADRGVSAIASEMRPIPIA